MAILTIDGSGFGSSARQLISIHLVQVPDDATLLPATFPCGEAQWTSSSEVRCVPPLAITGNQRYAAELNLSGVMSAVPATIDDATKGSLLHVAAAADATSPSSSLSHLSIAGFVIGGICVFAIAITLVWFVCTQRRFYRTGKKRVGQGNDRTTQLGEDIQVPTGVMISYSHVNTSFALELEAALTKAGFDVWIDTKIVPGEDWRANIAHAIELSFAVVVVLSPTSVVSKYCAEEVYYAAQTKKAIFPIVHLDCWQQLKGGIKMLLQRIQWLQFEKEGWEKCLPKLVHNLHEARRSQLECVKKNRARRQYSLASRKSRVSVWHKADTALGGHSDEEEESDVEGEEEEEDTDVLEDDETAVVAQLKLSPTSKRARSRKKKILDVALAAGTPLWPEAQSSPWNADTGAQPSHIELVQQSLLLASTSTIFNQSTELQDITSLSHSLDGKKLPHTPLLPFSLVHSPSTLAADVYVCFDTTSMPDLLIGTLLRDCMKEHGLVTYLSQRPVLSAMQLRRTKLQGSSDGRASPATIEDGLSGYHSRHSSMMTIANELVFEPDGMLGTLEAASVLSPTVESTLSPQRARSPLSHMPPELHDDCFEANAQHIDASTMMIFLASALSMKSPECNDELHYAYELSLPMLQVRLDIPGLQFHDGLLHGSVGMMLQRVPSVHWEADGQTFVELCAHSHVLKHKLRAEQKRRRFQAVKAKRLQACTITGIVASAKASTDTVAATSGNVAPISPADCLATPLQLGPAELRIASPEVEPSSYPATSPSPPPMLSPSLVDLATGRALGPQGISRPLSSNSQNPNHRRVLSQPRGASSRVPADSRSPSPFHSAQG